jgi:putative peptide zinc metalloprotease protein
LKDPQSGRFFRLKEKEHYIAVLFDGNRTFDEIAAEFSQKFGINVPPESIAKFHDKLASMGLIETEGQAAKQSEPNLWQKRSLLQKILFIKFKAFNPDSFLEKTLPLVRWAYSKYMVPVYLALVFIGTIILVSNRLELAQQLKTINSGTIPLIYITVIIVTILHELSHGYACKLYGGRVTEMGFLLQYFFLLFYTNISDAYLITDKKKRIAVTAAGLENQIIVWALATIVWRVTAVETIFNQIAFIIVTLSVIALVFNFNPLLKLDAYYYLIDKWGIPNLRARAFGYWKAKIFFWISPSYPLPQTNSREKRIFTWYGLASIIYSFGLFGYILRKFTIAIFDKIGVIGVAILYLLVLYMVGEALKKAGFWKVVMSEKGNILRPRNWIIFLVVLGGLAAASLLIKIDFKISQDCLIYPIESLTVSNTDAGYVELTLDRGSGEKNVQRLNLTGSDLSVLSIDPLVKEGDRVKSGELIAVIHSSESEGALLESRANLDRAKSQLQLLKKGPRPEEIAQTDDLIEQVRMKLNKSNSDLARAEELAEKGMAPRDQLEGVRTANEVLKSELSFYQKQKRLLKQGARPEEISIAEADIRAIEAKIVRLESQRAANNILAPIDGIVVAVKTGKDILTLARTDTMRVRIPVPEKEISPVKVGQMVRLKARGYPDKTFEGVVTKISGQTESGDVQPVFVITAEAPNTLALMKPGMTGRAKIYCDKWPIAKIVLWRAIRWFRVEFWSWF